MANGNVTIKDVYELIEKLEDKIDANYVHKTEFAPVKSMVYGMVMLVMMAVATAVVSRVVIAAAEAIIK